MTTLANTSTAFEIRGASVTAGEYPDRLVLRESGDGWSLIGPAGEVVYHALGRHGRHRCLQFAREQGVLSVFS